MLKEDCEDIRGIIFEEKPAGRSCRNSGSSILDDCNGTADVSSVFTLGTLRSLRLDIDVLDFC